MGKMSWKNSQLLFYSGYITKTNQYSTRQIVFTALHTMHTIGLSTTVLSAMPHVVSGINFLKNQPSVDDESLSLSFHFSLTSLSSSSSSPKLSLRITPSQFHSELKTHFFNKSLLLQSPSPFRTNLVDFDDHFRTRLLIIFFVLCLCLSFLLVRVID